MAQQAPFYVYFMRLQRWEINALMFVRRTFERPRRFPNVLLRSQRCFFLLNATFWCYFFMLFHPHLNCWLYYHEQFYFDVRLNVIDLYSNVIHNFSNKTELIPVLLRVDAYSVHIKGYLTIDVHDLHVDFAFFLREMPRLNENLKEKWLDFGISKEKKRIDSLLQHKVVENVHANKMAEWNLSVGRCVCICWLETCLYENKRGMKEEHTGLWSMKQQLLPLSNVVAEIIKERTLLAAE